MANTTRRIGVVLFQLGGPDTLEAIEPFLFNLFCDPDIIDFPFARIGRKPLAKLISSTRARKVQHHYASHRRGLAHPTVYRAAGAGSAVALDGIRHGRALLCGHALLASVYRRGDRTGAGRAMRRSRAAAALSAIFEHHHRQQPERVAAAVSATDSRFIVIEPFYRHDLYLDALVEKIEEALARFPDPGRAEMVFSAHSVPVSVIEKGDPYQRQIEETVNC